MEKIQDYPPNYSKIKERFPDLEKSKPLFSYGGKIYNPFKAEVTKDLEVHEAVHHEQQKLLGDVEKWWDLYLTNSEFRLSQEIPAYSTQYKFIKEVVSPKFSKWFLERYAFALSGDLYGNLISYGVAESKIRNYKEND
jgi:hypothetical protein